MVSFGYSCLTQLTVESPCTLQCALKRNNMRFKNQPLLLTRLKKLIVLQP